MNVRTICTVCVLLSAAFGLMFVVTPGATAQLYGVTANESGTLPIGRYFGAAMFMYAAGGLALATVVGLLVTLHGVTSGALNALGWSRVALSGFFALVELDCTSRARSRTDSAIPWTATERLRVAHTV